eukprot:jgi/Mesvir1/12249/Mv00467-RA.1
MACFAQTFQVESLSNFRHTRIRSSLFPPCLPAHRVPFNARHWPSRPPRAVIAGGFPGNTPSVESRRTAEEPLEELLASDLELNATARVFLTAAPRRLFVLATALSNDASRPSTAIGLSSRAGHVRTGSHVGRRTATLSSLAFAVQVLTSSLSPPAQASESDGRGFMEQALGLGSPDIFYPAFFEGDWDVSSTLISVEAPQGEAFTDPARFKQLQSQVGSTVRYLARFARNSSGRVVADRLTTTVSLTEASVRPGIVERVDWDIDKPNRIVLQLQGKLKVENLVTKRSFESSPGQLDTLEYSKQVFDNAREVGGPPTVKASQNITRYRWEVPGPSDPDPARVKALQRVSMFVVPAEFDDASRLSDFDAIKVAGKPVAIYKYLVEMTKAPAPADERR